MSTLQFSRWIALFGIIAGVAIAVLLPYFVLSLATNWTGSAQLIVVILALLVGGIVAAAATVVGITIPTAVAGGALDLVRMTGGQPCCGPDVQPTAETADDRPGESD